MNVRKQSGCVVFRYTKKFDYEILLVKSSDGKDWVFPKGGVEPDLTAKESAIKEVYEEAGVTGRIMEGMGKYQYIKKGKLQKVTMFSMLYTHDTPDWPEEGLRERKWFKLDDAAKKVPKMLKPFVLALRGSKLLALSSTDVLSQLVEQLRSLPVLASVPNEVKLNEEDECIEMKIEAPTGELAIRIEEWNQQPMSQKMTIHYDFVGNGDLHGHFKHTSSGNVVGHTARIIGRYVGAPT